MSKIYLLCLVTLCADLMLAFPQGFFGRRNLIPLFPRQQAMAPQGSQGVSAEPAQGTADGLWNGQLSDQDLAAFLLLGGNGETEEPEREPFDFQEFLENMGFVVDSSDNPMLQEVDDDGFFSQLENMSEFMEN